MKQLILPFILLNVLGGIASAVMFALSGAKPIWLGAFLTTFPLPFFLMVLTNALGIARTSARLPFIQLLSVTGLILVGQHIAVGAGTTADAPAILLAVLGGLFVQWYVWRFSSYGRESSQRIAKGTVLPEVSLSRLDGSSISSASFAGTKTLLVFFRANWCPFCMNQLKEVLASADNLKDADVQVKFISNQGVEHSKQLAAKLELPPHFEILQDDDLQAARALGIADIGGSPAGMSAYPKDTVMATVIALDENQRVIFGDETDNYRVRPHPSTFLPLLSR